MNNFGEKVSFIWSVADLLRGPYRPNQYKDVMLPLTVLRRLDCDCPHACPKIAPMIATHRLAALRSGKLPKIVPRIAPMIAPRVVPAIPPSLALPITPKTPLPIA